MEVREGAVWGQAEWTPRGEESLRTKAYRYLSPAFIHNKLGGILKIVSGALTNRPALDLPALAHESADTETDPAQGDTPPANMEETMDPKLLSLLGLTEDATKEQVLEAVAKLKETGDQAVANLDEAKAELETARSQSQSLDKFVPRADYDKALARAETAEKRIAEDTKAALDKEIEVQIDAALKAGKITPATVDYHKELCSQDGGLDRFKKFVEAAPVIAADSNLDDRPKPNDSEPKASDDALAIASHCGLTKEQYLAALED
jgi:phage I-like protein